MTSKAIMVIPVDNNPLGSCMSDDSKVRLLKMTQRYNIPIIEDDIYGDLRYKQPRPRTLHSFDTEGRVIGEEVRVLLGELLIPS